jgi:hypothetical protein
MYLTVMAAAAAEHRLALLNNTRRENRLGLVRSAVRRRATR